MIKGYYYGANNIHRAALKNAILKLNRKVKLDGKIFVGTKLIFLSSLTFFF